MNSISCSDRARSRRRTLLIVALVLGTLLARPAIHLLRAVWNDVDDRTSLEDGFVDDASRLNATAVAGVFRVPADRAEAEKQLAELIGRARDESLPVSIAGARHSMGGHTIAPGGLVVDMLPFNRMNLDETANTLVVGAGATWAQIIPYLDARGRSVAVMQSNNSFSVGGSISANCHGWQYDRPPIASTVESLRLMQADGTIVRCSREANAELFSLVLGGYGLFGIILDVELRVVPNESYKLEQFVVPVNDSLGTFDRVVQGHPGVAMAYARMCTVPARLCDEVIINVFAPAAGAAIPPLHEPGMASIRRAVFRGSAEDEYGKYVRWSAETRLQPRLAGTIFSRNQLLNEGVDVLQNRSATTTDVLHEYFVPRERVASFVDAMRRIVRARDANLLNVTVRSVNEDTDSFLRYADRPMIAFVMLFLQDRTDKGEQAMREVTRELIDSALANDGRYYLPYRLHATSEQFRQAYPQAGEFFAAKRMYDPDEVFQNEFYRAYGK